MLISQRAIAPIKAGANPMMAKPGTILATASRSRALITKVNSPRVRMLMGKVRITMIGLMTALMIPRTRATTKAVVKELTEKPGKYFAIRKIVKADKTQLARIAIKLQYNINSAICAKLAY